ncbi:protein YIF1B-A-like [Mya arenaria]|uniref:protein YIF1B-A-like n=1 Tax=Mya arenaria TaxID=6604 RepID=UPI0022E0950E|nr:protein YIF1B-A-like [Mya arenaria]XP_052776057.1 protein YIF1B-A-like [Mya arenaria]
MDIPSSYRQSAGKKKGGKKGGSKPQLFDDTSVQSPPNQGYGPPQTGYMEQNQGGFGNQPQPGAPGWGQQFPGQQMFQDPMANMAMQYGTSLAGQGKDIVNKNFEKYVSTSKLKYYFAVDTSYVGKKLLTLIFPFTKKEWSIKYDQDQPVAPRFDDNAPDLYIPVMAFVTYILVSGLVLGTQERFSPEQLGMQASTALVWLIIELVAVMMSLYIMNMKSELTYMDVLAYNGYKFVGMIFILLGGMLFQSSGFYCVLAWFSLTIVFFLVRTLKVKILPHSHGDEYHGGGAKRSLYLVLSISLVQPLLMWWLTRHIVFA